MTADTIIETTMLTKHFGPTIALNNANIQVHGSTSGHDGVITGLIGVNGAGKTTLIRCLLGIIKPSSGNATVLGFNINDAAPIRKRVGYMMEGETYIPGVSAKRYVAHMAQMSGLSRRDALQRSHDVLSYVGLGGERFRDVKTYSKGMKQKLKLAAALVHSPEILFLDEPTDGLDPKSRDKMLSLVKTIAKETGTNIFISTHILRDVERIARDILVMEGGRTLLMSSLAQISAAYEKIQVITVLGKNIGDLLVTEINKITRVVNYEFDDRLGRCFIDVAIEKPDDKERIMAFAEQNKIPVHSFAVKKPDLQKIVINLFQSAHNGGSNLEKQ